MNIETFLKLNNILYAICVKSDGADWKEYGDKNSLNHIGVVTNYLPDAQSVTKVDEMLNGQILPQSIRQGNVTGVLTKVHDNTIVALFYHDDRDLFTRRKTVKELNSQLQSFF